MNSDMLSDCPPADGSKREGILLIVDDDPMICRMLCRRLLSSFEELHTACTREAAEQKLAAEPITHLVCDNDLGQGALKGSQLVEKWRRKYPSIERAVLFSGDTDVNSGKASGIDAVIYKTMDFGELVKSLGL